VKIEGTLKPAGPAPTGDTRARPRSGAPTESSPEAKVELSSLSSSLNKAEAAMAATPAVDRNRVDEIRQAISEGRFKIDANRIADGLIESVRQMLDAQTPRP
jgi:negative regulator of flagellin synthesis FlgM